MLASGHASMALNLVRCSEFVLATTFLFERGIARKRVCTHVALSTESCTRLKNTFPCYGRVLTNHASWLFHFFLLRLITFFVPVDTFTAALGILNVISKNVITDPTGLFLRYIPVEKITCRRINLRTICPLPIRVIKPNLANA